MGQYFKPVNLDKKTKKKEYESLLSHNFGSNGLKLMEHSYIENNFVQAVEILLTEFGSWHKGRIVWAGDYADGEDKDAQETDENPNLYALADEETFHPYEIDQIKKKYKIDLKKYPFIVNYTLKQFVDKRKMPFFGMDKEDLKGWQVHPLPLLTAEGNGQGGGDYYNDADSDLVGTWARHSISIEQEIPKGYEELIVNFKE